MAEVASRSGRLSRPRIILAIDTALGAASACLLDPTNTTKPLAAETLAMERGHAEALIPLLDRLVARLDGGFDALGRVAVTVGPGSFTGIRVGVAAARAIGLARRIPVVGISTLQALAAPSIGKAPTPMIAAIDARHGNVYAQIFGPNGASILDACHRPVAGVIEAAGTGPIRLVGSGAPMLAIEAWSRGLAAEVESQMAVPDITLVARLGALADPDPGGPKPLYLKAPDVKLPAPVMPATPEPTEATTADA